MNLNTATITKLLALANKILTEHGDELVAIFRAAATGIPTNPPPEVPVPLPVPVTSLPEGFDEGFYLAMYPDVATAVRRGTFKSGGDHYIQWGMKEGRSYKPTITTGTVPPTAPMWTPKAAYASGQALLNDLRANNCQAMVAVDGMVVYQGDGFGPPMGFHTWGDGTVRTEDSGQIPLPLNPPDGEIINLNP